MMGYYSLIELSHDDAHQILENPDLFLQEIRSLLAAGGKPGQRIRGGRIIEHFHHRSDEASYWHRFVRELKERLGERGARL